MENKQNDSIVRISKFLSLVLRHSPEAIHLSMDGNGWVDIDELIDNAGKYKNMRLSRELIEKVVENNDKQRFKISDDGKRIRANQGHSITVNLELDSKIPPYILYHGTASRFLGSIMKDGIKPMTRQYVHLSQTKETALAVGNRHGKSVVLHIKAKEMYEKGYKFFLSENNVWMVEKVPVEYIDTTEK